MIPDLGIFFKYLNFYKEYHGTIFHSIIFALILFALLLIISEFNSKIIDKKVVNGIFMGILIHIFLDLILANNKILFYWPLPIKAMPSNPTLLNALKTVTAKYCIKPNPLLYAKIVNIYPR